ncbi:MAG TPA: N-acetylglucosamine-6-phosphate deacetylase [Gemmataceae bacterium]|jgi:N-acetylglucosamine-6-phosphate deacetylase|nr:N-acetylglucosamine-6-phosphate deacetylase [Gemmataceae bacterium]
MACLVLHNGTAILQDALLADALVLVEDGRIASVMSGTPVPRSYGSLIDLAGGYVAPGFVDLHVHGGAGADFMDGTPEAFASVCRAHARHGTTSLTPTSTVARHDQTLRFLELCRRFRDESTGGARVLGGHLYGPYFAPDARGCHPAADLRPPTPADYEPFLAFAGDGLLTATIAPELPGADAFVRACRSRGVRCNAGHSFATFEQMAAAVSWGVRHVDHLFCAMSDRARLRQTQTYPMRGGVMEATLFFDELTTEVIADGKHLQGELLKLAYKVKGPDRLTLVTDCMRALDMPDGEYLFGPLDGGERVRRADGVGITLDGTALASGVTGLDHAVRTFHRLTGVPLPEVVRMASLTPARVLGLENEIGSLAAGKRADLVVLDRELEVRQVFVGGERMPLAA